MTPTLHAAWLARFGPERMARWRALPADADSGDLIDLDVMALVFTGDGDELRLRAARRIAAQLDLRIHAGRGVRLAPSERADLVLAALFEVVEDGTPGKGGAESVSWGFTPAEIERDPRAVLKLLKDAVRERLTRDALGPAWRDAWRERPDVEVLALVAEDAAAVEAELLLAIERANLSPVQRRVFEAMRAAPKGEPQRVIAERLGMAPGTFRAQLDRARKKIRAAV